MVRLRGRRTIHKDLRQREASLAVEKIVSRGQSAMLIRADVFNRDATEIVESSCLRQRPACLDVFHDRGRHLVRRGEYALGMIDQAARKTGCDAGLLQGH